MSLFIYLRCNRHIYNRHTTKRKVILTLASSTLSPYPLPTSHHPGLMAQLRSHAIRWQLGLSLVTWCGGCPMARMLTKCSATIHLVADVPSPHPPHACTRTHTQGRRLTARMMQKLGLWPLLSITALAPTLFAGNTHVVCRSFRS
jgi:hypothetical protein